MAMNAYIHTSLVGGTEGDLFNDILKLSDAEGQLNVDTQDPIRRIDVSHGWEVDGFKVWYKLKFPGTQLVAVEHGSQFNSPSSVQLNDNEVLIGVFGRAGYQNYYKRKLVNSIGFIIFNKSTLAVRTAGPFGNSDNSNQGEPFHVANVIAFGGYAKVQNSLGLAGISFYKTVTE